MAENHEHDADRVIARYQRAKERRSHWEGHWQECYEFALPQREGAITSATPGEKKGTRLFDATASDAVDQLSASLLSELTPPWSRWFAFKPGKDAPEETHHGITDALERAATILQGHFDRSNFAVEMHQCYLDLVTAGTACLMFEEAPIGESSAFRFTAVPLSNVVFEESIGGKLDATFRRSELTVLQFNERFPSAAIKEDTDAQDNAASDQKIIVIEAVIPSAKGYDYVAVRDTSVLETGARTVLKTGSYRTSPFINFRWLKAPGEVYGRSPVMKALPDIKTANKVVELILKNAAIAVTGIWQADDDGVLNPATIRLEPGTIIPKAVGSAGLTPLKPANDMNLSNIVLDQMRERIRHALMVDMLGQPNKPNMSATEVIERSHDMARLLGATYGRLQSELLTPLALRAVTILQRRGEIAKFEIDGRVVELNYTSPLARHRAQREAAQMAEWITKVNLLGPQALQLLDPIKAARHLASVYGVPADLLRSPEDMEMGQPVGMPSDIESPNFLNAITDAFGEMANGSMTEPEVSMDQTLGGDHGSG